MQRPAKPCTSVRFRAQPPPPTLHLPCIRPSPATPRGYSGKQLRTQHQAPNAARVAKLVYARDLKSLGFGHAGSIPAPGTIQEQ
jgi:hypothetical protein